MKTIIKCLLIASCLSATAYAKEKKDIHTDDNVLASCPEEYLTYYDKSEGGPGAYCACPEDSIRYKEDLSQILKSLSGSGFYCKAPTKN